ncbi:hypothetical protein [Virgibacillus sp. MG-45]|uniref:hypothetical protein n=1 Tax=Virgibacillus sp. MG-45 TaxID=3102791 RepID=UPI002ED96430
MVDKHLNTDKSIKQQSSSSEEKTIPEQVKTQGEQTRKDILSLSKKDALSNQNQEKRVTFRDIQQANEISQIFPNYFAPKTSIRNGKNNRWFTSKMNRQSPLLENQNKRLVSKGVASTPAKKIEKTTERENELQAERQLNSSSYHTPSNADIKVDKLKKETEKEPSFWQRIWERFK